MKSKKVVTEVLTLMKFDPWYVDHMGDGKILEAHEFALAPVKIIDPDRDKRELEEFSQELALIEDRILAHYDSCNDLVNSLMEQQLILEDGLAELKRRNKRKFKNAHGVMKGKMTEMIEFGDSIVGKIERLVKLKNIKESTEGAKIREIEFDVEKNDLTPELKIGTVRVRLNGAELAFYLQLFNDVGWLPDFEGKKLGQVFTNILRDNFEHLKEGEYEVLKDFHERFSQVGHIRQEKSNNKKLKAFKKILTSTIERAEQQFLSEDNNHDLIKN